MNKIKLTYLVVIFLILNTTLNSQNQSIRFNHIDIENGLSQNNIRHMIQDTKGFIWFATWDGLSRYDGYEFKVYKHIDGDSTSLRNNKIRCLLEDHAGRLWVGTFGGGLSLFNSKEENFINFYHNPDDSNSISSDLINSIFEDSKNRIWIGTKSLNISLLDNNDLEITNGSVKKIKFKNYKEKFEDIDKFTTNGILSFLEDNSGNIWCGSENGFLIKVSDSYSSTGSFNFKLFNSRQIGNSIIRNNSIDFIVADKRYPEILWLVDYYKGLSWFDIGKEKILKKHPYYNLSTNIPISKIESILIDNNGSFWFGTYGSGIYTFIPGEKNKNSGIFNHYKIDPYDPYGVDAPNITQFLEDRGGLIWIGTSTKGIYTHHKNTVRFNGFYNDPFDKNSLVDDNVLGIIEDNDGNLWIGTEMGLDKYNPTTKKFEHFHSDPKTSGTISANVVYCMIQDKNNIIWVGTEKGLDKYIPETNSFINYKHNPEDPDGLTTGEIIELFNDSNGNLWIGSWGGGLSKLISNPDKNKLKFLHYRFDENDSFSISNDKIMSIAESPDGKLWFGTSDGGLNKLISDYRFNEHGSVTKPKFERYQHNTKNPNSLSNDDVRDIYIDEVGNLWLGTFGGGLNLFNPAIGNEKFIHYREKDGLPNDVVRGIEADDEGNLWIGTANGLSKFNPEKETFLNFDVSDGLQTAKFEDVHFKSKKNNVLYFGGVGGILSFDPSKIIMNKYKPNVVITSFERYNVNSKMMIEEKGISEKKKLVLSYKDNILNFKFSALNYFNSTKNKYSYKLEGYNNNWIQLGNKRDVTFTNLDPGNYTLFVKGSNNDGIWNDKAATLELIITPPWWQTGWAYIMYGLIFIAGVFVVDRVMRRKIIKKERDRAKLNEAELIKKQAEELEIVDRLVRVINRADDLENLFNSLLKQTMNILPQAEKAAVFLLDKKDNLFRVAFTAGYKVKELEKIVFTPEELLQRYSENGDEVEKGIFIINETKNLLGDEKLSEFKKAKSMLVMAVEQDNIIEAYVVFDSFSERNTFDHSAARLLNRFREHAVSAISKAQAIKILIEKNEEILKTQEQLLTQQKLASLGALTAGIAHEIKNPLNFVNNFAELSGELLDELNETISDHPDYSNKEKLENIKDLIDNLKLNLSKINIHGSRANSIIKGMLLHSRGSSGEKTLTDLNDLLDQYVNLAYHGLRAQDKEFNITIEKDYDKTLEKINVVPQDLSRVFLNIINNACYSAYKKKKKSENSFSPVLKVSTKSLGDKVKIRIGDNGNGIPSEVIDKIFQPFFTTKPTGEGTGLGLSLSYDIVTKMHNGDLKVETKEGEGAEFIIVIPKF